jgi:hypothetical protein
MAHRPYPNADRALAQVRRSRKAAADYRLAVEVAQVIDKTVWRMHWAAAAHTFAVDEYRLSTR